MVFVFIAALIILLAFIAFLLVRAMSVEKAFKKLKREYKKAESGKSKRTVHEVTVALIECASDLVLSFAIMVTLCFEVFDCIERIGGLWN